MICVNVAMKQDDLIKIVTNMPDYKIEYVGKKGMTLEFKTDGDEQAAAAAAKKALKATAEFRAVYFQIDVK